MYTDFNHFLTVRTVRHDSCWLSWRDTWPV